ncbi:MAG: M23 family metallopeptidase [Endomicrobium sp.]|nr:M23 family metallopeptidase [Endomicrobium sp.]
MGKIHEVKCVIERRIASFLVGRRKKSSCKTSIFVLFLCAFVVLWNVEAIWSRYFSSNKTKSDNKAMRVKPFLFANRLKKTKHLLEKIQVNGGKIRSLLALGTKKSIIEDDLLQNLDKNGFIPEQAMLATVLLGNLSKINYAQLPQQVDNLYAQNEFTYQGYNEMISRFMTTPCGKPCNGRITSHYGFRSHPTLNVKKNFHDGLDIANVINTPVRCTASGKVVFSGWQSGYGNIIVIDHGHNYRTAYGHLSKKLVTAGTYVHRGQIIAKMGNTGISTGSHVHYEVHFRGKSVNPKPYLVDYFCST